MGLGSTSLCFLFAIGTFDRPEMADMSQSLISPQRSNLVIEAYPAPRTRHLVSCNSPLCPCHIHGQVCLPIAIGTLAHVAISIRVRGHASLSTIGWDVHCTDCPEGSISYMHHR
eukprot:TRINITY_DN12633_c0_g1_i1.p1 TRINITY_DN12633_c0_g1~~TRINITY_DN12633_c0_g1_i1.p1  ORF type:complete len:114 (+),score=0.13 TRINITY_DN12633_c0_g1_i1:205-546(+)